MRHLNLDTVEITHDASDPEGYRAGRARLGRLLGAEQAGASLYELPPGQGNCPYHYEVGDEEWLLVLAGRLTVRHPDGEDELGPGEIALFPAGPDGAHKLTNRGEETVRVILLGGPHPRGLGLSRQRQGRHVHRRPGGERDGPARRGRRLLARRGLSAAVRRCSGAKPTAVG